MKRLFSDVFGKELACGCALAFLPEADFLRQLPLEKSVQILEAYDQLFLALPDFKPKRMLEIGVKHGGGLALFKRAFPDLEIIGVDKEPKLTPLSVNHLSSHVDRMTVMTVEAPSGLGFLTSPFDLVVDDGSHAFNDILGTFDLLWPRLAPNGLYVVEDWKTDASRPYDFIQILTQRMIGYWPDPVGPKGAPAWVHAWREILAIKKGNR